MVWRGMLNTLARGLADRQMHHVPYGGREFRQRGRHALAMEAGANAARPAERGLPEHSGGLERHLLAKGGLPHRRLGRLRIGQPRPPLPHRAPCLIPRIGWEPAIEEMNVYRRRVQNEIRPDLRNSYAASATIGPLQDPLET